MRNSLIIVSIATILSSNSGFATLEKDLRNNIVRHISQELNIERDVAFTGFTFTSNLLAYSDQAAVTNAKSMAKDSMLDINIVSAEVVRFYNADYEPYNGLIAYIVKTKDGSWYIKFQVPVLQKRLKAPVKMAEKVIPDSALFRYSVGVDVSGSSATPLALISGRQGDIDSYMKTIPGNFHIQSEMHYIWATVLLTPDSREWNQSALQLNIADLHCNYHVVESEEFGISDEAPNELG